MSCVGQCARFYCMICVTVWTSRINAFYFVRWYNANIYLFTVSGCGLQPELLSQFCFCYVNVFVLGKLGMIWVNNLLRLVASWSEKVGAGSCIFLKDSWKFLTLWLLSISVLFPCSKNFSAWRFPALSYTFFWRMFRTGCNLGVLLFSAHLFLWHSTTQ